MSTLSTWRSADNQRPTLAWMLPFAALLVIALSACGGGGSDNAKFGDRILPTRKTEVRSVEISVAPRRVDNGSAVFAITLDTHSRELNADLKRAAALRVAGSAWRTVAYEGDGPGGHHREGTLRFRGGPARGAVRLTITGFGRPAVFDWPLGTGSGS